MSHLPVVQLHAVFLAGLKLKNVQIYACKNLEKHITNKSKVYYFFMRISKPLKKLCCADFATPCLLIWILKI